MTVDQAAKDRFRVGDPLTERELGVLAGIAAGMTNPAIGRDLHLSEQTIKTHARHVFRKLGVCDRAAAVSEGYRRGLLAGAMLMDTDVLRDAVVEIAATREGYVERFVDRNIAARTQHTDRQITTWRMQAMVWWDQHHPALVALHREYEAHRGAAL